MANMNIGTPRFYVDEISYLMSRGVAASEFAVTASNTTNKFMGTFTTGSAAELFDLRPLNKVTFDTSADTDAHVVITIDTQSTSTKKSFVAILNHNMNAANAKVLVKASDTLSHVQAVNFGSATAMDTPVEVTNANTIGSSIITADSDGNTIVRFNEQSLRYWGIQFEGNSGNVFSSTDLFVGSIMLGEYFDMPHSPDLDLSRMISYNRLNDLQESHGGQRFSNLKTIGRTATSTSKSPFTTASNQYDMYGGRIIYDMKYSFLNNTELMPDEYDIIADDDNFISDVWNKTNGNHLPFIFSIDKSSEGDNAESEHIFGRFANNSLDMTQVAPEIYNISLTVEEEF